MGSSFRWNDGDLVYREESGRALRAWVPAFAGMTVTWFTAKKVPAPYRPGSWLRRNDGDVVYREESARALRAWVPAFAGMTIKSAFRGNDEPEQREWPCATGLGPGVRRDDD